MKDLKSGREYFEEARKTLGYNNQLELVGELKEDYTIVQQIENLSMNAGGSLDWLSHRIALECGQGKDTPEGRYITPEGR